ncbi:MAG: hypothetical protein M3033_00960 [Acidobacteriota bacterium]|nr:hypothetical protein [Acidobacteriota bacterium]
MFSKKDSAKFEINYRGFTRIEGSDFLVSPLSLQENASKGRIHYITYNYLFLDIQNFSTSWLFPSNNQVIQTFYQIPLDNTLKIPENIYQEKFQPFREDNFHPEEVIKTGSLMFVFTKTELNQDKQIVALSDISGENFVEILNDVDSIYDKIRVSKDSILLMYSSNEKVLVSEIMLSEKKVVRTKELPKTNE